MNIPTAKTKDKRKVWAGKGEEREGKVLNNQQDSKKKEGNKEREDRIVSEIVVENGSCNFKKE